MSRKIYIVGSRTFGRSRSSIRASGRMSWEYAYPPYWEPTQSDHCRMAPAVYELDIILEEDDLLEEAKLAILEGRLTARHVAPVASKAYPGMYVIGAYKSLEAAARVCDRWAASYEPGDLRMSLAILGLKVEVDQQSLAESGEEPKDFYESWELQRMRDLLGRYARIVGASVRWLDVSGESDFERFRRSARSLIEPLYVPAMELGYLLPELEKNLVLAVAGEQGREDGIVSEYVDLGLERCIGTYHAQGRGALPSAISLPMKPPYLDQWGVYAMAVWSLRESLFNVVTSEDLERKFRTRPVYPRRWRPWQAHTPEGDVR